MVQIHSCCKGSPPLTRGILSQVPQVTTAEGITPAYAGNTLTPFRPGVQFKDHPRLRGEYAPGQVQTDKDAGSPPLTRGIPAMGQSMLAKVGITPAYAGNTTHTDRKSEGAEDHPRLRGEYIVFPFPTTISPRITPAYAGNTNINGSFRRSIWDHPRLRGEYTYCGTRTVRYEGSPPLTRGIQAARRG